MMLFHMVRNKIGDQLFWQSLRDMYAKFEFKYASWEDFFSMFSKNSHDDLSWMVPQWVDSAGAPKLAVDNVSVTPSGSTWTVEWDIKQIQGGFAYRLDVPYVIKFSDGTQTKQWVKNVTGTVQRCLVRVGKEPVELQIDPDFDLFRALDPKEAPPTLSGFLAEEKPLIILPDSTDSLMDVYTEIAAAFNRQGGATVIRKGDVTPQTTANRTILYLGNHDSIKVAPVVELNGSPVTGNDIAVANVWRDSADPNRVHLAIWGQSAAALKPIAAKLPHYGKYSCLAFSAGNNVAKGTYEVHSSPLNVSLKK